jgi:hypothetical protein
MSALQAFVFSAVVPSLVFLAFAPVAGVCAQHDDLRSYLNSMSHTEAESTTFERCAASAQCSSGVRFALRRDWQQRKCPPGPTLPSLAGIFRGYGYGVPVYLPQIPDSDHSNSRLDHDGKLPKSG